MQQSVILCGVIFLFLMGCAPKSTLFEAMQPSSEKGSIVYVYRSSAMANAMVSPDLLLNGDMVSKLERNSYLYKYVPSGRHVLSLDLGERYTGTKKIILNVSPNTTYFIRLTSELHFEMNKPYTRVFNLEAVDSSSALHELSRISVEGKSELLLEADEVEADASSEGAESTQFSIENSRNPFSR